MFPRVNLKAVGTHSGISIGEDGPLQMSIEDFSSGLLPRHGFVVICPADEVAMIKLVKAAAEYVVDRCSSARGARKRR